MYRRIVMLAVLAVGAARAADWPQWRGAARDLTVKETGLLSVWPDGGPQQVWQVKLPGSGYSEPCVVAGRIYVTGSRGGKKDREGVISALDAKTGATVWSVSYGAEWGESFEMARTTPTFSDGRLYVFSGKGVLACLAAADGKMIWSVDTVKQFGAQNIQWGFAESPLVYDGKVICQPGGPEVGVAALDVKTGAVVWTANCGGQMSAYCSADLVTLDGRRQLVTMLENAVVGLDPEKGTLLWSHPHRNRYSVHPNPPIVCGPNRLYVSSGYNYGSDVIEVAGKQTKLVWHNKIDNHFQGAALRGGLIYSSGANKMALIKPADGSIAATVPEARKTSFVLIPSGLITYDENGGKVQLVSVAKDGTCMVKSSFDVKYGSDQHWSSPVVVDGVLYLRRGDGIAAFRIK